MPNLIKGILHPGSRLETVTLCLIGRTLKAVCDAIQDAVHSKFQRGQSLPIFRLSPALFCLMEDWEEWEKCGVDVEMFDPIGMIAILDLP